MASKIEKNSRGIKLKKSYSKQHIFIGIFVLALVIVPTVIITIISNSNTYEDVFTPTFQLQPPSSPPLELLNITLQHPPPTSTPPPLSITPPSSPPWEGMWKGVAEWFNVSISEMETVFPNLKNFDSSHIIDRELMFKN